jgi:hypothetical protein
MMDDGIINEIVQAAVYSASTSMIDEGDVSIDLRYDDVATKESGFISENLS